MLSVLPTAITTSTLTPLIFDNKSPNATIPCGLSVDLSKSNNVSACNDIRANIFLFNTEFVNDPKNDNQKKIDVNINKNFEFWKLDFMLLLIEYYKKYTETHELKPTNEILKWTNQYKENTDLYLQFLNECTEFSEIHIKTCDMYESFKFWFKTNNPNTKIPNNASILFLKTVLF